MISLKLIFAWLSKRLLRKPSHAAAMKSQPGEPAHAVLKKIFHGWQMRIFLAALATLLSPVLYLVCLVSVIGIPLAFILAFVPAAAALYISAELLYRIVFRRIAPQRLAIMASIAVPIVSAVIAAQMANATLDRRTAALVAGDRDRVSAGPIATFALIDENFHRDEEKSACTALCLRLLLTGAADEVLIANLNTPIATLDPAAPAIAVRFEKGAGACVSKRIEDDGERVEGEMPFEAAERARLRVAAGECLVERPARINEADAALLATTPARGISFPARAGLDLFADTLRAKRLSFHRKEGGAFREEYRRTIAWSSRHPMIAFPAVVHGYQFETAIGFFRLTRRINVKNRFEVDPDRFAFLREKLGLDLSLAAAPAPDVRALIDGYIAGADARSIAARDVIADFIDKVARSDRSELARDDAMRIVALLSNAAIELPVNAWSGANAIARNHEDLAPSVADALLDRIEAAAPGARQSRFNDLLIKMAAHALTALPDASLAAERERLLRLLADKDRRLEAAPAFALLAAGGAEAVADLVAVIDAALEARAQNPDDDDWRDLYHSGLVGLCNVAAPAGAKALLARLEQRPELKPFPFRTLAISTLIKSGAAPGAVRAIYAPGLDERGLGELDADIKRALSRADCS